jgi:hypothetical protein
MIFARETSDTLTSLVKKIDEATTKNARAGMASFVVFTSDEEGLDKKLKDLAEKQKLSKCALTIENVAGPKGYKINKDADITVVLYVKKVAKANYAFKKGEFKEADVEKILADLSKILP